MDLHPQEAELIRKIREQYRFGEIVIECRDGLPIRIARTVVYEALFDSSRK
jgi:hypothetical protein